LLSVTLDQAPAPIPGAEPGTPAAALLQDLTTDHALLFPPYAGTSSSSSGLFYFCVSGRSNAALGQEALLPQHQLRSWVQEITADGQLRRTFGGSDLDSGLLNCPTAVAISEQTRRLIVVDNRFSGVYLYDLDSTDFITRHCHYCATLSSSDTHCDAKQSDAVARVDFRQPYDVAVTANGCSMVIIDYRGIVVMDILSGRTRRVIGKPFMGTWRMAVDDRDILYVAGKSESQVSKFDLKSNSDDCIETFKCFDTHGQLASRVHCIALSPCQQYLTVIIADRGSFGTPNQTLIILDRRGHTISKCSLGRIKPTHMLITGEGEIIIIMRTHPYITVTRGQVPPKPHGHIPFEFIKGFIAPKKKPSSKVVTANCKWHLRELQRRFDKIQSNAMVRFGFNPIFDKNVVGIIRSYMQTPFPFRNAKVTFNSHVIARGTGFNPLEGDPRCIAATHISDSKNKLYGCVLVGVTGERLQQCRRNLTSPGCQGMVQIFNPDGESKADTIKISVLDDGSEICSPEAICVHPVTGHIFIADSGNQCITEFTYDSKLIRHISTLTIDDRDVPLSSPTDVCVLATGEIVICDQTMPAVHVVTSTGVHLRSFGLAFDENEFIRPSSIAVDCSRDRLYVVDPRDSCMHVVKFSTGQPLRRYNGLSVPFHVRLTPCSQYVVTTITSKSTLSIRSFKKQALHVYPHQRYPSFVSEQQFGRAYRRIVVLSAATGNIEHCSTFAINSDTCIAISPSGDILCATAFSRTSAALYTMQSTC
jgi:NHL repeat